MYRTMLEGINTEKQQDVRDKNKSRDTEPGSEQDRKEKFKNMINQNDELDKNKVLSQKVPKRKSFTNPIYLITSGAAMVELETQGEKIEVVELRSGEIFGYSDVLKTIVSKTLWIYCPVIGRGILWKYHC
jgi:CRP-like cAMP-binding protein